MIKKEENFKDCSPREGESHSKSYVKRFLVEIFDNDKCEIYEKHIEFLNEWDNINKETCEAGKIINSICTKLLRGDCNYDLMLESVMDKIIDILSSEIGSVNILSENKPYEEEPKLTCIALSEKTQGIFFTKKDNPSSKEIGGIFGYSFLTEKVIISNKVQLDKRFSKNLPEDLPEDHPKIDKIIIIPLKYQKNIIGLLSVANREEDYSLSSISSILPLISLCSKLIIKSLDSRGTLASKIQTIAKNEQEKDKFLATMSHELRTPLNGIMGMVTLFPDSGPLNPKQKEYIRNLTECTVKLTSLLNNFLDFTKMSSDRISLKKQPFFIKDVVDDSVKIIQGNSSAKNLELNVEIDSNIPSIIGDKQRLIQILSNLLSNSVKFTDKGSISLTVKGDIIKEKNPEASAKWKISFCVKDTGIGIPLEEQDKIFEVFYQSSNLSSYLSQSGTGLGLAITQELIRLMGGKIKISSEGIEGKGSTFEFYIILDEELNINKIKKEHIKRLTGSPILIVDDRSEIRIQLSEMLFKWKCSPQAVSSAEEALQYLQYGMKFKVALIDINMPQMSGVELAQEIRSKYPHLPLIGISSIELKGGEDYFDFYMYKPIDQNVLFPALLDCIIKPKKYKKISSTSRKKKSKKNLKILVAEDDSYNVFTIKELLLNLGYSEKNIKVVCNGMSCVEEVRCNSYDVILMDIIMPEMDGLEASKRIKRMKNPPMIIAVSAAVQPSDKDRCQNVGIDGYISKPILKEKLNASLSPLICKKSRKECHVKNKIIEK